MKESLISKSLAVVVILLFIGMSVVPSMSSEETGKTDITVKKGYDDTENAFVCGFVTDKDTGLPIEGVRLELWWKDDEGNHDKNDTYTNISGYYNFVTKAGYIRIWAHASGYLSEFKPQCAIEPYETLWINVSLFPIPPFTSIICGYITDKDTGDPISQAYVYLYWKDNYEHFLSNHTYSNASGFYQMDAPAGEINIYAVTDGHFLKQSAWYFIEEGVTLWINLSLTPKPPETAVVCGYITDKMNGEPINQVDVCLDWRDNEGNYGYNNTLTDISGFYKMHVAPGYIYFYAYKPNYVPQPSPSYWVENNQTLWINISLFPDETIFVDDDNTEGPWDGTPEHPYQYIQDGIDNPLGYNTIFVYNGTYFENIIINKSINLIGESKELTIIDGRNAEKDIITISQDFVNINNIQIKNSLINCNGIYITTSRSVTIKNCVICEISGYAFELDRFHDSQIIDTDIYRCGSGIHLMYSTGNNISNNFILRVFHQGIGAYAYSNNNLFSHNDIIICSQVAVVICQSENNQILNNTIIDNDRDGIIIRHNSNHNTIKYNNIAMTHDGYGIIFEKSSNNNMIVKNNFLHNKRHASFVNSKNIWRENFWDKTRIFPKIIFGKITIGSLLIPWINFDWRPAREPYDIPIGSVIKE